ncbi:MAG: hypothetical protein CMH83_08920 [Nocardioides sp.]|nr:hypothetical protein [Nocardioides sp.]
MGDTPGAPSPLAEVRPEITSDPRVAAVMEVLSGARLEDVAAEHAVEAMLLRRWVRGFVEAGVSQVTNRPVGDVARERDRFLATFMHGLRSPLAVAQMWVGLLKDSPDDARPEVLDHLQETLDQLNTRASEVELLTAALLGRVTVRPDDVRLGDLTHDLVPPERIGGDGPETPLHVDPALFQRILGDLWAAATAARPLPRAIRLESLRLGPWREIRVVREGSPVDTAVLHAMFEPFDVDNASTRVTVGLYLARTLTVLHGGTVGVEQDDERTAFWVRVPAEPDSDHPRSPTEKSVR